MLAIDLVDPIVFNICPFEFYTFTENICECTFCRKKNSTQFTGALWFAHTFLFT